MTTYRFIFESHFMGESDVTVFGDGEPYRLRWRISPPSDYERRIFNGTPERFLKEVVAFVGGVGRGYQHTRPAVWEAFCRWAIEKGYEAPSPTPVYFDLEAGTWRPEPWLAVPPADCELCGAQGAFCAEHDEAAREAEAEAAVDRREARNA